ncbi:hypothetical protein CWE09_04345 [Aliidiomarina minuta]|uniref:5-methyltetrahydrofolate--homocysteine methyltransferase n=1 Tax=Aliidiomarina minuta TaxID=880057 RepID=A0A432W796_9GAMM|nr:hypothetical protein [Aliidiomarina minuta]RUO25963.1 hypothetical protein CWE09_04345 [Aliidiomarina minuta]
MMAKHVFQRSSLALAIASVFFLSACDTSVDVVADDNDHDHDHEHENGHSTGRLVITEDGTTNAFVYDLGENELFGPMDLGFESRLYTSPGYRYALAVQRSQNQVRFIDSGYESEDHDGHSHDHEHDPELLSYMLTGEMPTHYDYFLNRGAVFYDGTDGTPAKVEVVSDHSIAHERLVGDVTLDARMHGAAEVRNDWLFTSYRSDPGAESTLPDYVEVYELHDDHYDFVDRFDEPCEGLHGSAINQEHVAFGCSDGVLVISDHEHDHEHHFETSKIANLDGRIGTLYGHPDSHIFVGVAGDELYRVDPDHGEMQHIDWRDADHADAEVVSMTFNYSGNRFAILDDHGYMTIVRFRDEGHDDYPFQIQSHFSVLEHVHDGQAAMTASAINHDAYIMDVEHNRVVIVDLHDGEVIDERDLDFTPAGAVWLGPVAAEDDHDHDH